MLKGTRANWTIKTLVKEIEKENVTFDNAVQRTLVWKKEQKALLIDSILRGYPIPQMYANRDTETGIFDMLDGKQRSNAIASFIQDEFELTENIDPVENENGVEIPLAERKFSDLPEDLQDRIFDYTVDIIVYDNLTDDEIAELFMRINNGKPLSAIELTRVKAKSLKIIQNIGTHEIFNHALTAKALAKYGQEDIVMKSYCVLFEENPSFETKIVRPIMERVEITDEQAKEINNGFTKIFEAYKILKEPKIEDSKENKKRNTICKRILVRTHLLSLMVLTPDENTTPAILAQFCKKFFDGGKATTISPLYNANLSNGVSTAKAVQTRLEEIKKCYNEYIKSIQPKDETESSIA